MHVRSETDADAGMLPELFTSAQWKTLGGHFGLNASERDVARLLCRECSNKSIAMALDLSDEAVGAAVVMLLAKLDVRSRVGVPVRLMQAGRRIGCAGAWNR